jgi:hypothetical protein
MLRYLDIFLLLFAISSLLHLCALIMMLNWDAKTPLASFLALCCALIALAIGLYFTPYPPEKDSLYIGGVTMTATLIIFALILVFHIVKHKPRIIDVVITFFISTFSLFIIGYFILIMHACAHGDCIL